MEQSRQFTDAEAARLLAEEHDYLHELLPEPIAELRRAICNKIAQEIENAYRNALPRFERRHGHASTDRAKAHWR